MGFKRKPKRHLKSQAKKSKVQNSQNFTMETIFDCFPTLSEDIFESLDEESLAKFVEKFHLNPAIRRTTKCSKCQTFVDNRKLKRHEKAHLSENYVPAIRRSKKSFNCRICRKTFKDHWKLNRHGKVSVNFVSVISVER